ncbi:MAG: ABC transporter permease [Candidatus Heimdallarchaeota archaeon]|nr:ABC transporter permease [Candidatus Heimdallarchaeota archaeon]
MKIVEFILYRFWALILQVLGAVALIFALIEFLPYDPTVFFLFGFRGTAEGRLIELERLRASLGLDIPVYQRYINFFENFFTNGSLGYSWTSGIELRELYGSAMTYSFLTFGIAFLIYSPLSLIFGILAAKHRDSVFDYFMRIASTVLYSVPPVIFGLYVVVISVTNNWGLAPLPTILPENIFDLLKYLLLPILVTVSIYTGFQFRLIRIQMLNVLKENYIRTARAKGLHTRTVIYKHALRNALPPFLTIMAVTFPIAFSGIAALEIVFGIPGGGVVMVDAALNFDWPVLIAGTAVYTTINAIILALTDLTTFIISPKLRHSYVSNK